MRKILLGLLCWASIIYANPAEYLKQVVWGNFSHIHGWCSKEKAFRFIDLVLEVKPETCVEIGVFGGKSLFPVAVALKHLNSGIVIGIDPWDKEECLKSFNPNRDQAHLNWWSKINLEQIYHSYLDLLSQNQLEDYCITLRSTSEKAAPLIGSIDILHLDGSHSEAGCLQDIKLYLPKVRKGGYIWLNDSLSGDLQPALDLLFESCEFVELVDGGNCVLFRKK